MPKKAVFNIQAPGSLKTLSLTSSQLEQWCATVERDNKPNRHTDFYLTTLFLSRFGLKNSIDVIEFLKTEAGKTTIAMIREELIRIEEINNSLAQQSREEALMRERRLVFILMGVIAQREEHAKYVAEITQQQIDEKLKESKHPESTATQQATTIAVLDASIKTYTEAIKVLDIKQKELQKELRKVEKELEIIQQEGLQLAQDHAITNAHLDQLSAYLQLVPLLSIPGADCTDHANQQIASLTTQLAALRVHHAARSTISGSVTTEQDKESNISRKIRMLEEQLAFHHNLIKQPPQSREHVFQQLVDQVRTQLSEKERLFANQTLPRHHQCEMDGLRLQEHGLRHAMQLLRKERVLLNAELEQVDDYNQACFIVHPNHTSRYRKHGDSYAIFEDNVDLDNLSEMDWLQAKLNFDRLKSDVHIVHVHHKEKMQQQVDTHQEREQHHQKIRDKFISQMDEIEGSKTEFLKALTSAKAQRDLLNKTPGKNPQPKVTLEQTSTEQESLTSKPSPKMTPKPDHQSSYSLMMKNFECLVPTQKPAPRQEEIQQVCSVLETIVPPDRQSELKELIDEVHPGEIMTPDTRLSWLQRAKSLIPRPESSPDPEFDLSTGYRMR